jgi:hypothetical protein
MPVDAAFPSYVSVLLISLSYDHRGAGPSAYTDIKKRKKGRRTALPYMLLHLAGLVVRNEPEQERASTRLKVAANFQVFDRARITAPHAITLLYNF